MKFDIWVFIENLSRKFTIHWYRTKITGTLHKDQYTCWITYRLVHPRMRNISDKGCIENQNTLFAHNYFLLKSYRLWDNVGEHCRAWQGTDEKTEHAHCVLDTWGYKQTLRICNKYWFSTATLIKRARLNITLYVHCLTALFVLVLSFMKQLGMSLNLVVIRSIFWTPHP